MRTFTLSLDTTARDLIPGDPRALLGDATSLRRLADALDDAEGRLGRVDVGAWEGDTAEAFSAALSEKRARLVVAVVAWRAAASALECHADNLASAQQRAADAIADYWATPQVCVAQSALTPAPAREQVASMTSIANAIADAQRSAEEAARVLKDASEVGPGGDSLGLGALFEAWVGTGDGNPWHGSAAMFVGLGEMTAIAAMTEGRGASGARGPTALSRAKIAMYERLMARKELPAYLQGMFAGSRFNWQNYDRYEAREIWIRSSDGSTFRLDSYTPGEAVVSRRLTQLSDVQESTAMGYLDEITRKYQPNSPRLLIADTPMNRAQLGETAGAIGSPLRGQSIFEIPPQAAPVPPTVLEYAASKDIVIADPTGRVYRFTSGGTP